MEYFLGIDYPTWWFLVIGACFSAYAILDGFDLGAGILHLFFRKEESRRIALNAIGPVWDGNEVWIVIGGGALFAGFPKVYASVFSSFYIPFMLFLVALIFRAISIEFRSKEPMAWWRKAWDVSYSISSGLIAFLLGVTLGNVVVGIPIDQNGNLVGSWLALLNPFALLTGIVTLALFTMHGALYLLLKTEDRMFARLTKLVKSSIIFFVLTFTVLTLFTLLYQPKLRDQIAQDQWLFFIPLLMTLGIANIPRLVNKKRYQLAFFNSAFVVALLLVLVAVELFPVMVPSSIDPRYSLTIYNSSASMKTLGIMLGFAAVGVPLVAVYTTFVFWTFKGKVKIDEMSY